MRDVYAATHWAIRGAPPAYDTPDEDVYLPGRNIVLLGEGRRVLRAQRGSAASHSGRSPATRFPMRRRSSSRRWREALSLGLGARRSRSTRRIADLHKEDVVRRGAALGVPFELTLSCMNPVAAGRGPVHCGACSKCRERHDAFLAAGVERSDEYAGAQRPGSG